MNNYPPTSAAKGLAVLVFLLAGLELLYSVAVKTGHDPLAPTQPQPAQIQVHKAGK